MWVVQHVGNQVGRDARFLVLEATRRHRRCANAHAAGDEWFFGVVRNGVLVDRHVGCAQSGFGFFAGDLLGAQVHQHHMALSAAADDAQSASSQSFCHDLGVLHHLGLVVFELRLHGFFERHGFCRDDVHQRAALQTGEDGAVDRFFVFGLHQDDAAAWAAQALVGGGGHHVSMRHRVGILARGDQACVVGHVDQEDRSDFFGDLGKACPVNVQAVSRRASHDELGLVFAGFGFHGVVVDGFVGIQTVRDNVEPLA